ncbi:type I pantothenate kinase [Thermoplasmatales archaeon AK]|nr:type I pantothenate kinase [Thermoplasmatales archaeon AK]
MVAMISPLDGTDLSPYIVFDREHWSRLRNSTPMTVNEEDLATIRGINERISVKEVEEVYLPLSRLLGLYFDATKNLYEARRKFLSENHKQVPYIIGMAGSVAVGKSTTARLLKTLISRWPGNPKVELIATDGFLYPNRILEERGLMNRKGFPESYDIRSLIKFLYAMKSGQETFRIPVYSHLIYDIIPGQFQEVSRPDIIILEGLNVLQTRRTISSKTVPEMLVSDFFDFSIYVDAKEEFVKKWYIERFLIFRETAFRDPKSFFRKYGDLSVEEAVRTASRIWDEINGVNLKQNIEPTKFHAHLVLTKGEDHSVTQVMMRKL